MIVLDLLLVWAPLSFATAIFVGAFCGVGGGER
jgi:hypothetical protein